MKLMNAALLEWLGARQHPTDNQTIIMFVYGGITATELRECREVASAFKQYRVIIGSTEIATAETIYHHVMGS